MRVVEGRETSVEIGRKDQLKDRVADMGSWVE